jgi:hypothetical protein
VGVMLVVAFVNWLCVRKRNPLGNI